MAEKRDIRQVAGADANNIQVVPKEECITKEELTELVRAIKFAKPEASMRTVHWEITQELSQKPGFAFLANVAQNDVKKVWKKAQQPQQNSLAPATHTTPDDHETVDVASSAGVLPPEVTNTDHLKLYTVGNANIRLLAQEYSQGAAAAAATSEKDGSISDAEYQKYVHVFLDVPADRSGARPHQALINFQDNTKQSNKKKNNKKKQASSSSNDSSSSTNNIVKIQVAASDESTKYPMLLYNADRSLKTFIHPDPSLGAEDGYDRIRNLILNQGVGGSLGIVGGTKAYFHCRLTRCKKGPSVVSIDVTSGLAPTQSW